MKSLCLSNPTNLQRDVVILTVPWTDSSIPLMAPAALKPIVEKAGLSCLAVDLNVEVYEFTKNHTHQHDLIRFFFDEYATTATTPIIKDLFLAIAEQIVSWRPKYVGLSLISYVCQHSAKWIAYFIKKLDPSIKIIAGGPGCLPTFTGESQYVNDMLNNNLFDYHIRGDGELSLYELLIGNTNYKGINSLEWQELNQEELRSLPTPDYENYMFDQYEKKVLPLIGSRGCVRQCKFCDYIANWTKFQFRTADDIFSEMLFQYKKYNITQFKFQDSLTNGNQREFYKLTQLLADYNKLNPENKFTWSGYYIFRELSSKSEEEWEILAHSGAQNLAVGIENLNEHIRYAIGKKFSNKAISFHLAMAKKHNIFLLILNIVGYVNETEKDIEFIKQWLHDNIQYKDNMIIQWGGTLGIFPNTYLSEHKEELGIKMIGPQPSLWINESIGSTPASRAKWATELNELSKSLGYQIADNLDNHFLLETLINDQS